MNIRPENPQDIEAIHHLETAAFDRTDEADLVDRLRDNGGVTLSLVAEQDGKLVGHILFSPVMVEHESGTFTALGLGPVAVLPEHQNQGIGSALIINGLERCREMGHSLVFLIGHPTYYPRFGFQPAVPLGFDCAYVPDKSHHEHFMVIALQPGALAGKAGYMRYRPEFDGV